MHGCTVIRRKVRACALAAIRETSVKKRCAGNLSWFHTQVAQRRDDNKGFCQDPGSPCALAPWSVPSKSSLCSHSRISSKSSFARLRGGARLAACPGAWQELGYAIFDKRHGPRAHIPMQTLQKVSIWPIYALVATSYSHAFALRRASSSRIPITC